MTTRPPNERLIRWYRLVLLIYPRRFRRRYARHMEQLFEERCRDVVRDRGSRGLVGLWAATVRDGVVNGLLERLAAIRAAFRAVDTPARNATRRTHSRGTMTSVIKDLRYAVRTFARNPAFTIIAVATLALGIGANTAIFSVVRAVLLAPLPYEDPDRLVLVWSEMTARNVTNFPASPPDLADYREADLFETVAAVFSFPQSLTGEGEAEQVTAGFVTTDFLPMLGVRPLLGRGLTPEDATPFNPFANPGVTPPTNAVILSHGLWERRYGGEPGVLGRSIQLGGGPAVIVGVMQPDFELLLPPSANISTDIDLWTAARVDFDNAPRGNVFLIPLGRMREGVTVEQAQAQLDGIAARIRNEFQVYATAGYRIQLAPLHEDLTRHVRPTVLALLGAVGFVLLIACANVANLLMVRATARSREISIRAALGGSRWRLVRQMLAESVVLSALGGGLGLLLAAGGVRALLALKPADLPRIDTVGIDGVVLVFTAVASLVAAVVFGMLPALQASRANLADPLKGRANTGTTGWPRHVRAAMVVAEVALSLVLLIGTGLMVRSFVALQRVDPGFDPDAVLTFQATIPFLKYPQASERAAFQARLGDRLAALPGVTAVGAVFPLPLDGQAFNGRYGTASALEDERNFLQAEYRAVHPGYFQAMQTTVLAGRTFTMADYADSLPVVVVDEVLARKTWPSASAVGERLLVRATGTEAEWVEVIGVVAHQRHASLAEEGRETIYFTDRFVGSFGNVRWTVRAATDPLALTNAVRATVAELDASIPVSNVRTMDTYVAAARAPTQFALVLIAVFGVSALVLASVGLYGVLSYVVRQRTAEIGIRMAFGAQRGRILKLVVGQGMGLAALGIGIGLIAAAGLTRVMASMLVGIAPTDPLTFAGITTLFIAVAFTACLVPALRATRVDPLIALRED